MSTESNLSNQPEPIGSVHYSEVRAVQVRAPGDMNSVHSAAYSNIAIYADNKAQMNAILAHWQEIMQAASSKVDEILAAIAPASGEGNE